MRSVPISWTTKIKINTFQVVQRFFSIIILSQRQPRNLKIYFWLPLIISPKGLCKVGIILINMSKTTKNKIGNWPKNFDWDNGSQNLEIINQRVSFSCMKSNICNF